MNSGIQRKGNNEEAQRLARRKESRQERMLKKIVEERETSLEQRREV